MNRIKTGDETPISPSCWSPNTPQIGAETVNIDIAIDSEPKLDCNVISVQSGSSGETEINLNDDDDESHSLPAPSPMHSNNNYHHQTMPEQQSNGFHIEMNKMQSLPPIDAVSPITLTKLDLNELDLEESAIKKPSSPQNTPISTTNSSKNSSFNFKKMLLPTETKNVSFDQVIAKLNGVNVKKIRRNTMSMERPKYIESIENLNVKINESVTRKEGEWDEAVVVEDDDDLFDYKNVQTPQELMAVHEDHADQIETTLSFDSEMLSRSHSRVPSQRPTTEKEIMSFWDNSNNSKHARNVTLVNMDSVASSTSRLNLDDLEQHIHLLHILKSQGLMKNTIELLHCHQRLARRQSQLKGHKLQKSRHSVGNRAFYE